MENDPLLKFLYKLRTEILKEGTAPKFGPPPPNAKIFFIGDAHGGTGWEVGLPEDGTAKYYVDLPVDIGEIALLLVGAPTQHLDGELPDRRLETICSAYYAYLDRLVRAAKRRFIGGGA